MLNKTNAGKTANHKNGNQGIVIDQYTDTRTGKEKVTVKTMNGRTAYWPMGKVVIA